MNRQDPSLIRRLIPLAAIVPISASLVLGREAPAEWQGTDDPRIDSARAEMAVGRFFHASELLHEAASDVTLSPEEEFLLAQAEAGYRNWAGVLDVMDGAEWVDGLPGAHAVQARAREALGRTSGAIESYRRSLAVDGPAFDDVVRSSNGLGDPVIPAPEVRRARLARLLFDEGERDAGIEEVDRLVEVSPILASAVVVASMDALIEAGDSTGARTALMRVGVPWERSELWQSEARAVLAAQDTARAIEIYTALSLTIEPAVRKSIAFERLGNIAMARGDSAQAIAAYQLGYQLSPSSNTGARSARALAGVIDLNAEEALTMARALDRIGSGSQALRAYDLHYRLAREAGDEPDARGRVERARLAATVPSRVEEAIEEYRALDEHPDPAIGARVLELWAGLRRRQGETSREATLREWLIERYPNTSQAAQVVFLRADRAHDRQEWDRALALYGQVATMAPTRSQAGLSRMRIGQIHFTRGAIDEAEANYASYLADFPNGGNWEEASYWTARARVDLGRPTEARPLLARLQAEEPFDYYTVITGNLLGEEFSVPEIPVGSLVMSEQVRRWIREVELMDASGLREEADRHVGRAIETASELSPQDRLVLAHGLNELGRTIDGINLGWALRREGMPWSQTLLSVVYPFPFREMIEREADEWGLDPLLVGALIRQESAFVEDIRSSAGAIGLMQVMPATGRQVASAVGPENFSTASLETGEVNLHLGASFLIEMLDRFGPELPLVLSAYNAGPTRANRWKNFPEIDELDRFTERIPFAETRGYVKNITRNLAIYRAIYGERAVLQD